MTVRTKLVSQSRRGGLVRWIAQSSSLALAVGFATPVVAQQSEGPAANAPVAPSQGSTAPNASVPATQAGTPPETTAPAATVADNGAQIGDVIVTARRVQERLQDIPASVSAITGDQVTRMSSLSDIQSMVSGVTFKAYGPIPTVGIRGFGNRTMAGVGTNSTVGIFEDGVFVAPPLVVDINRIDTQRVEVAKGPQSTLYGRSSFTGAINIVSNDPTKQFSGYVDGGYGGSSVHGENLWHVRGAVSIPLTDTLSVRFFGLREKRDGFTYDSVTGNRGGGYDRTAGRFRILWQPSSALTARLTGTILRDNLTLDLTHTGRNPAPLGNLNLFQTTAIPPIAAAVANALTFGPTVWDAIYPQPQSTKTRGEQLTLDVRLQTPIGEFASLTDFQHSNQDIRTSLDLTRLNYARGDTLFDERRGSQELRLSNKTGGFTYLLGLYYLHSEARTGGGETYDVNHPFASFSTGAQLYDLAKYNAIFQPSYVKTDALAAFGQVGYDFTNRLNLTLGIRQSRDELSGPTGTLFRNYITGAIAPASPFAPAYINRRGVFDATTGSANLSYKIQPDVIVYGSYSRGNSPGGLNVGALAANNYAPQNVDAFEAGLKSQLLNRKLQLNVALFDNQYKNLQITQNVFVNGALNAYVTNAGNGRGRGVDLDATAIVSRSIRLGVQYTYAESKITRYILPLPPSPQVDFTGVPLVRSPKHTANGSATFTHDIGPGKFAFTAEESYTSSYTNDYQGVPAGTRYPAPPFIVNGTTTSQVLALFRTPGYALTNLNASYTIKNIELSGYVRNLFNHQYVAAVLGFDTVTYPQELPGEPRTFEVSVKYSF